MYNLNTLDGKKKRVNHLHELYTKLSRVRPTEEFTLDDIESILSYLDDVKLDLQGQISNQKLEQ